MPINPPSKPNSRTSTPSLYILSPASSTTNYTSSVAGSSSPDMSSYKYTKKKQLISQGHIRSIIKTAFREFRGIDLVDSKLQECEEIVCHDNYMLSPTDAAMRIFDLVDKMEDIDLIETTLTITQRSSVSIFLNRRRSTKKSIAVSKNASFDNGKRNIFREVSMESLHLHLK